MDDDQLGIFPDPLAFPPDAREAFSTICDALSTTVLGRDDLLDRLALSALLHHAGVGRRMLFVGPSGAGKTHTALAFAQAVGVPYLILSAAEITEPGWTGHPLSEHLGSWVRDVPLHLAERGVVVIDELDKLRRHPQAHGNAPDKYRNQQSGLLPLLGIGTPITLGGGLSLDMQRATIICTGAFSDATWAGGRRPPTSDELVSYGLISELVDRLTERVMLDRMPAGALARIYADGMHGAVTAAIDLAERCGYRLRIDRGTYLYAAEAVAAGRGGGAGPRVGAGWLEEAATTVLARALRQGMAPGTTLLVTPDDVPIPNR